MLNFCTLFDIKFISQGLTMYEGLKEHCTSGFKLYVFAFCDECYKTLQELNLSNIEVISLNELEKFLPELITAKQNRTTGEYCWTCESATILYCLKKLNLDSCTYVDADLFFFANPVCLIEEMNGGGQSVLITEHRYTPEFDQTKTSGKYCVQFVHIKNTPDGLKVLNWWVKKCIQWCFNRFEDGKFGDQKYLDDWPQRFQGIHELQHLGGGVAPWNVQQYQITKRNKCLFISYHNLINIPLIFYHFHNIKINNGKISQTHFEGYPISKKVYKFVYLPYLKKLKSTSKALHKKNQKIAIIKHNPQRFSLKKLRKFLISVRFGKEKHLIILGRKFI